MSRQNRPASIFDYPSSMKVTALLALIGFVVMSGAIIYGFLQGDFTAEGRTLLSIAWGQVSLIDVYLGFLIFSGWILYRQGWTLSGLAWVLLMLIFGNATASLYILKALLHSDGEWHQFWLGRNSV
jgi:hypothetical protein